MTGSDLITFGTRCGTRNGVEIHVFRVETQRDLAYWSRALVQGSHGAAVLIKEVTCGMVYSVTTYWRMNMLNNLRDVLFIVMCIVVASFNQYFFFVFQYYDPKQTVLEVRFYHFYLNTGDDGSIRKAWPWIIANNMFGDCHTPCILKTSFPH